MLVIVEKPSIARALHPQLTTQFPSEQLTYLFANPYGWPFVFDYPSKMSWQEYPLWRDARYRLAPDQQWQITEVEGELVRSLTDYETLSAQAVLAVPDMDRGGFLSASRLVHHLRQLSKVTAWHGYRGLMSLAPKDVAESLSVLLDEAQVLAQCDAAQLKADFEFSFLVNAAGLLTRSYQAAGGRGSNPVFSKYTVQALYALRRAGATSEGSFIQRMDHWSGTGRYAGLRARMGSPASYGALLENMKRLGLAGVAGSGPSSALTVTALGDTFLDQLHPDCEDADLPFRLEQWLESPAIGRPAAQRYIRTWFGKQKRFHPASSIAPLL